MRTTLSTWAAEVIAILLDPPRQEAIRARMLQCAHWTASDCTELFLSLHANSRLIRIARVRQLLWMRVIT